MEDRLEALEAENASLRKYNEYHQVVHEIDHMSDLHVDSSFYKQSMKLDNYFKINKWIDFSIRQSTVLQELNKKRPKLSNSNQTQNRRRYVNFENGSHFICSFNPITYGGGGLFGPDHQIIDHNSKTALSSTSKLGDFLFLSIRHTLAEF